MPQTTAEKKFFLTRAEKFLENTASKISKSPDLANFQQYKGILKNVTGGEE